MALSEEMTHVYDGGSLTYINGMRYNYTTDTAASKTSASATLTYGRTDLLSAQIEVSMLVGNSFEYKMDSNAMTGNAVTTSVNNTFYYDGVPVTGVITAAVGTYFIGRTAVVTSTVN